MTQKERDEKRQFIYNSLLFELQLLGLHSTTALFLEAFKFRMQEQVGECTEADEQWVVEGLDRFAAHMEKELKKGSERREGRN